MKLLPARRPQTSQPSDAAVRGAVLRLLRWLGELLARDLDWREASMRLGKRLKIRLDTNGQLAAAGK